MKVLQGVLTGVNVTSSHIFLTACQSASREGPGDHLSPAALSLISRFFWQPGSGGTRL